MGWQWHQPDHMQIICTSLQTDNHASTSPLSFTAAKHWRHQYSIIKGKGMYPSGRGPAYSGPIRWDLKEKILIDKKDFPLTFSQFPDISRFPDKWSSCISTDLYLGTILEQTKTIHVHFEIVHEVFLSGSLGLVSSTSVTDPLCITFMFHTSTSSSSTLSNHPCSSPSRSLPFFQYVWQIYFNMSLHILQCMYYEHTWTPGVSEWVVS